MEKSILKTLRYADALGYPLKLYEIHKWLIGRKATPRQIEKVLKTSSKIKSKKEYFFLKGKEKLVSSRIKEDKKITLQMGKIKLIGFFLRLIPWIKLVGTNGKGIFIVTSWEEDLSKPVKDIFSAHQVLEMKILWERDGTYKKYLEANVWAFKFLPNWISKT